MKFVTVTLRPDTVSPTVSPTVASQLHTLFLSFSLLIFFPLSLSPFFSLPPPFPFLPSSSSAKLRSISMCSDYEEMASRDYTGRQGTLLKLNELKLILDHLPPPSSISLTSASSLVPELFTHRGTGIRLNITVRHL